MATQLADILFLVIIAAIAVAQGLILRSTARGMRHAGGGRDVAQPAAPGRTALEWLYAIVPAIALAALLLFSWRAMHPESIQVRGVAPSGRQS